MSSKSIGQQIQKGQAVAKRLAQDLHIAQSSWAHWEAMNGEMGTSRQDFRDAINWLLVSPQGLVGALLRDTLMALSRNVDKNGASSLRAVTKLLNDPALSSSLIARARDVPMIGKYEERLIQVKIQFFTDRVPPQWHSKQPPPIPDLHNWRVQIEELRNQVLAHSGASMKLDKIQVNKIREGFELISPLVEAAHHIFVGSLLPNTTFTNLVKRANRFWDYGEIGFIEASANDRPETPPRLSNSLG
jgi:hypothetical protein